MTLMEKPKREAEAPPETQKPGAGIDRTVMRRLLKLTPAERIRLAAAEANNMAEFDRKIAKG